MAFPFDGVVVFGNQEIVNVMDSYGRKALLSSANYFAVILTVFKKKNEIKEEKSKNKLLFLRFSRVTFLSTPKKF